MHLRPEHHSRLGNIPALIRVSRGLQTESLPDAQLGDDAITRKRRLVAMFCKMLGEQLHGDASGSAIPNPPPVLSQPLSPRQRQTLELLLTGHAEKQIAARLAISRHTVHVYVKSLYKSFGVCSRGELLARWVQR